MANTTYFTVEGCDNTTDGLFPLTAENYGEYLNGTINFYRTNSDFANLSDFDLAIAMCRGCKVTSEDFLFTTIQLVRVIITWALFFISAVGNIFVLCCVCRKARSSHVHMVMMHFAIADLTFTFLVLPQDAMWNTTMEWLGGEFLCRLCQMGKQIGMYISSFMVVVMAVDRCCGILQPLCSVSTQRKRTKYLVGGAWILSVLSAVPPVILFSVSVYAFCPRRAAFLQCMDNTLLHQDKLRPYYFYTMAMSFLLPMILCFLFYSLIVCEISNMIKKDRNMMGRRDSAVNITRARKKTLKMTALVTLSFLLFWGPYYGYGVYYWFHPENRLPKWASAMLFILMYVHPAIHPFIYGVLMKDVRDTFKTLALHVERIVTCSATELSCGDGSFTCLTSPEKTHYSQSNGYVRAVDDVEREQSRSGDPDLYQRHPSTTSERRRLVSDGSELGFEPGDDRPVFTRPGRNGTATRPSQVSFKLPNEELPRTTADGKALRFNNNKEEPNSRDEDVFTSTHV